MNKKKLDTLPFNVVPEPEFKNELEAYTHYAVLFNIEDSQEDALLYETYINLPPLKKTRSAEERALATKYDSRVKALAMQDALNEGAISEDEKKNIPESILSTFTNRAKEFLQSCYETWVTFKNKVFSAFAKIPLKVSVDTGKHNTKFAYRTFDIETGKYSDVITDVFESRVSIVNSLSKTGLTKLTKIDGKNFLISKEADRVCSDIITDIAGKTKAHEFHRVLLVEALRRIKEITGRNLFDVVVGVSVDSLTADHGAGVYLTMLDKHPQGTEHYDSLSIADKKNYVINLMNDLIEKQTGVTFNVEYASQKFDLIINDLLVSPETQSGAYSLGHIDDFECKEYYNTYLVDIGGLNRTILAIIGGTPQLKTMDTNYNGMTSIVKNATKQLIRGAADYSEGTTLDKAFVERSIKFYDVNDTCEEIDDCLFDYFDELTNDLRAMEGAAFNRLTGKLIFIGGGAQSLKAFIKHYYKTQYPTTYEVEVVDDALYSNVVGMYYFGQQRFEERAERKSA